MDKKKEKAIEYAKMRYSCNNGNRETKNEIAKVIACRVGFEAGWEECMKYLQSLPLDEAANRIVYHGTEISDNPTSKK